MEMLGERSRERCGGFLSAFHLLEPLNRCVIVGKNAAGRKGISVDPLADAALEDILPLTN